MGRSGDSEYFNPAGNLVTIKFRGISFMDVIHDALEDGAELTFSSQIDVAPDELKRMLRSKEELTLFRRNARLDGPDVASGEIVEEIRMKLGITRP
jgi:CBS-domain-containing membrane protein